jgi:hypothetical protein
MDDNKITNKTISIFTQAVDNFYSKDNKDISDSYYSYDGCDVLEIDKILDKSNISKIDEEMNDYSTHGVFSDEDSNKNSGLSDVKCNQVISNIEKKQRKLTDFFQKPWVESISCLKKQVSNRIDKNNFLEGICKISNRKLTFDTTPSNKFKTNSGFN